MTASRFRSVALLVAASLGFATIFPAVANEQPEGITPPPWSRKRQTEWWGQTKWSHPLRAYKALSNDSTPELLRSWRDMRKKIRNNYPNVMKPVATQEVQRFILAVLNKESPMTLEGFNSFLASSPTLNPVKKISKAASPFLGGFSTENRYWDSFYRVNARRYWSGSPFGFSDIFDYNPPFRLNIDENGNFTYSSPSSVGGYFRYSRTRDNWYDAGRTPWEEFGTTVSNVREFAQSELNLGLGDGWKTHTLSWTADEERTERKKGTEDVRNVVEVSTNAFPNSNYATFGVWLRHHSDSTSLRTFVHRNVPRFIGSRSLGTATYKGVALGYYATKKDHWETVQRLTGKVTLNVDLGNRKKVGSFAGSIHDLALNGRSVDGVIELNTGIPKSTYRDGSETFVNDFKGSIKGSNIDGFNFTYGEWSGGFYGGNNDNNIYDGIVGSVSGQTALDNSGSHFGASFGARKVEAED